MNVLKRSVTIFKHLHPAHLLSESEMEFLLLEQQIMAQLLHRNPNTVIMSPPAMIMTRTYHRSLSSVFPKLPSISLPSLVEIGDAGCPGAGGELVFLPAADLSAAIIYKITKPAKMISIPQVIHRVDAQ